jgi:hypothetical protein
MISKRNKRGERRNMQCKPPTMRIVNQSIQRLHENITSQSVLCTMQYEHASLPRLSTFVALFRRHLACCIGLVHAQLFSLVWWTLTDCWMIEITHVDLLEILLCLYLCCIASGRVGCVSLCYGLHAMFNCWTSRCFVVGWKAFHPETHKNWQLLQRFAVPLFWEVCDSLHFTRQRSV